MKSWVLMCGAIILMHSAASLAEDDKTAKVDDGDIKRLINQLDSEVFAEREEAVDRLTKLGRPAIEALRIAAAGKSIESRSRSMRVLKTLLKSDNEATKEAAKKALEKLRKSDHEASRRLAEKILAAPQYEIPPGIWRGEGKANVFGGLRPIVLQGEGGVSITGAGIRLGADGQLTIARVNGGERRIDIIKGTGVGVLLLERRKGIEIHVRRPQKKGDPQFSRYLAKDSKELAKKHPKIHKLYKKLDVYKKNQTIIGGVPIDF